MASKQERGSRRVDGRPETDADRRFFDLRESGWTGPVDQDGNAVMTRTDSAGTPAPLFGSRQRDASR